MDRASACEAGGSEFESRWVYSVAGGSSLETDLAGCRCLRNKPPGSMVSGARLEERLIVIQEVAGSTPVIHPLVAEQKLDDA